MFSFYVLYHLTFLKLLYSFPFSFPVLQDKEACFFLFDLFGSHEVLIWAQAPFALLLEVVQVLTLGHMREHKQLSWCSLSHCGNSFWQKQLMLDFGSPIGANVFILWNVANPEKLVSKSFKIMENV